MAPTNSATTATSTSTQTTQTPLRDVVAGRVNGRWDVWARQHPHLAQAIDRVRFIESTTARLRDDPEFQNALRAADLDEAKLAQAARLIDHTESVIGKVLAIH